MLKCGPVAHAALLAGAADGALTAPAAPQMMGTPLGHESEATRLYNDMAAAAGQPLLLEPASPAQPAAATRPGPPNAFAFLSVPHRESILYGVVAWVWRSRNGAKRRVPTRAVSRASAADGSALPAAEVPRTTYRAARGRRCVGDSVGRAVVLGWCQFWADDRFRRMIALGGWFL
jgi:hypothetical protein